MTLDEIAYNIRNLYRGGRSSQDDPISLSQLKFNIKYYRAMFIRRDYARNGLVNKNLEIHKTKLSLNFPMRTRCPSPSKNHQLKQKLFWL